MKKVPEITAYFWIIKVLTTAFGESASDYLVVHIDPIIAVGLGFVGLVIALAIQLSARRYIAWLYWFAAIMVAIFGTMAADVLHVGLGVPYIVSAISFAIALCIIFVLWHYSERTLSIHSINTARREMFYWATVLATFALGTAVGDLTATTFGLGYLYSGIFFVVLIALAAAAYYIVKKSYAVFIFWVAYILTRPFGASFADWMSKSRGAGGLGWGDGFVSTGLFILIVCFVGYLSVTREDVQRN